MTEPRFAIYVVDYDSDGNIEYIGRHTMLNASYSDSGWFVAKHSWDADGNWLGKVEVKGPWSSRKNLKYG